jgi:hypothetical protein
MSILYTPFIYKKKKIKINNETFMDSITKKLSVREAKKLVYKLINDNNNINKIDEIEKFWLVELDKCHLTTMDSKFLNRIFELKNNKTEPSISLYNNCIKGNVVSDLLKKNWRRLFNNDVINKYHIYISQF